MASIDAGYACPVCNKIFRRNKQGQNCLKGHGFCQCLKCFKPIKINGSEATSLRDHFNEEETTHATEPGSSLTACPWCSLVVPFYNLRAHMEHMHFRRDDNTTLAQHPRPQEMYSSDSIPDSAPTPIPAPTNASSTLPRNPQNANPGPSAGARRKLSPVQISRPPRGILKDPGNTSALPGRSVTFKTLVGFKIIESKTKLPNDPVCKKQYAFSLCAHLKGRGYKTGEAGVICWL